MRSKWSAKAADRLGTSYEKSVKNFHPETVKIIRVIFEYIQKGHRVTYHGITEDFQTRVVRELKELGYEVKCHGQFSPDSVKYSVKVV